MDPIKKSAIAEEISKRLLEMIKEKQLSPGDKLPPERELAGMLGVSRPSLREALRALSIMNIIEIRQGDGTYITSLEPDLLVEHLDFIMSLDDSTLLQLLEARKIVEVGIASLAADRINPAQMKQLEILQKESSLKTNDYNAFLEVDLKLHEIITEAAGNPFLKRFMTSLSRLGLASRRRTAQIPGVREQTLLDHEQIITALENQDGEKAALAMLQHLENIERRLENVILENDPKNLIEGFDHPASIVSSPGIQPLEEPIN